MKFSGAFAVVFKGEKILLVKPPDWATEYSKHWNFPGGIVEPKEALKDAARREVYEETAIMCSIGDLIDTAYNEKFDISINIFRAEYVSGSVKLQEDEIIDAKWFSLPEALKLPLAFEIKKTLKKLLK